MIRTGKVINQAVKSEKLHADSIIAFQNVLLVNDRSMPSRDPQETKAKDSMILVLVC